MDKFFEVRESSIDNKGIFATKLISKGTKIIQYIGEIISGETIDERYKRDIALGRFYLFELDEETCIDGLNGGNEAIFVNHSCDPNCDIENNGEEIWYITNKDIMTDEELTVDYEYDDIHPIEKCKCKSTNCRGYILSEKALDKFLYKK
jgi:uncharacterized protein